MAADSSPPTSDFPAESTQTNQKPQPQNSEKETRKDAAYKTKKIKFLGRTTQIILQNENGPCPLIAISNVLLLSNAMNLSPDITEVSQEELMILVAGTLIEHTDRNDEDYLKNPEELMSDAMNIIPCLANGLNVDIKFTRINDFESTPEKAIFDVLKIPLYHGWIVDPKDTETAAAIGCKSYNALTTELVTLEAQTAKARRGDTEEQLQILQALRLSELEALGFDTRRDSSSGGESMSGFTDDSFVYSVDTESSCGSTPDSKISQKSRCDCDVGNKINNGEEVPVTKISGALGHDQLSEMTSGDCSKVTSSVEKTNLESTKTDSSPEIPCEPEAVTFVNPDLSVRSQDDEDGISIGSPVSEGESHLEQSSAEVKDASGLTPKQGEVIKNFLEENASQLTSTGISCLKEDLKERELCVFFRNNHFSTMLKYKDGLYLLVTDQGYLTEKDLVWEKLIGTKGESVFMTGNLKVFKSDSGESSKWDQLNAVNDTADFIFSVNSSSKEGMEIDPDLKMAVELQQQELANDIDYEVPIRSNHLSSPIQEVKGVQRWQMYNHVYKSSSCPLTTSVYFYLLKVSFIPLNIVCK